MTSVFTKSQRELMTHVLDRIIPPAEGFPGAGELGVTDYVDGVVAASTAMKQRFNRGLAAIELAGRQPFPELSDADKDSVLRSVEADDPDFFEELVLQTYNGYYTNRKIVGLLGLEPRPPQPMGYEVGWGDLSRLDRVRERGQLYRDA